MLAALAGGLIAPPALPDNTQATHRVSLVAGPIHYDFILPLDAQVRATFDDMPQAVHLFETAGAQNVIIGWGATGFYTTVGTYTDITASALWRGITGDTSVMRLDIAGAIPPDISLPRPLREITMTDTQYAAFLKALKANFASTAPLPHQGFNTTDLFFASKGRFHIGRTCNVWVGDMLRRAGLRFGIWTPIPASITLSHTLYHQT